MAGAGSVAFFATQGDFAGIHQIAEKLPTGGRLETRNSQRLGNAVHSSGSRHRTGHTRNARLVARHQGRMGCDHGQAVAGRHHKLAAHNHVAVSVAIARSTHVRRIGGEQMGDQVFGIHRIRVRVQTAEIFQRHAIDHGSCGSTQLALQQGFGIGAAHRAHGVIAQGKAARKQLADGVKVKQAAHHFGIVATRGQSPAPRCCRCAGCPKCPS